VLEPGELTDRILASPGMEGQNLVDPVTATAPYRAQDVTAIAPRGERTFRVAAYDFGIKFNILRLLAEHGCDVTVYPAATPAADLLATAPDGVFLSNGPGDPAAVGAGIANVTDLLGRVPVFGICLGHQIMALALGASSYKLKFGHRGINQPVKRLRDGCIEVTSHNHGFTIDAASLPAGVEVTHLNLNDGTCEGIRCRDVPAFSVQYHPEASPGPHDARYLFDEFVELMS
jgi:carbamoyl-phosphate synthase small subunit